MTVGALVGRSAELEEVEPGDGVASLVEPEGVVAGAAVVLPSVVVVVTLHSDMSLGKHLANTLVCAQLGELLVTPLATVEHSDSIDSVPLHTGDMVVGDPPKSWLKRPATAPATGTFCKH